MLVIGLDGATFRVLQPMAARGYLPILETMLAEGAHGTLLSTDPCVTGPAWTSLATGKRPDTHGILDWSTPIPGTYRRRLLDARAREDLALWEILAREGLPAGTLNLPLTYPPSRDTSFCVSGLLTPAGATDRTHPSELREKLESMEYHQDVVPRHYRRQGFHAFLEALIATTRARGRAIRHCLAQYSWRAAVVVFTGPDRIQHAFWHLLDPFEPTSGEAHGAISFYQVLDQEIGRILEQVPANTHVYLVSDHGFGPHRKTFYVNDWLEAHGYLHRKAESAPGMHVRRLLRAACRRARNGDDGTKANGRPQAVRDFAQNVARQLEDLAGDTFGPLEARIDWSRTMAFAPTPHGVQVNVQGREPRGIVPLSRHDDVRAELRKRLARVRDPRTGEPIHAEVLFREEKYTGQRMVAAPDLVYRFRSPDTSWRTGRLATARDVRRIGASFLATGMAWESGTHTPDGILVARGPEIRPGALAHPVPIWDLLPTLLYHLGLPIPPDLDGKVITSLFHPSVLAERPVRHGTRPAVRRPNEMGRDTAEEDVGERSVMRRLEDLGYLS